MTQRLEAVTAHVANVSCRDDESDDDCLSRAEGEVRVHYPPPHELDTKVFAEPNAFRLRYLLDGDRMDMSFDTAQDAEAHMRGLIDDGKAPTLLSGEAFAQPDAPRFATVRAMSPSTEQQQLSLRMRLTLEPSSDSVMALATAQQRATAAAFSLQSWDALDDGSFVIVLSCRRASR